MGFRPAALGRHLSNHRLARKFVLRQPARHAHGIAAGRGSGTAISARPDFHGRSNGRRWPAGARRRNRRGVFDVQFSQLPIETGFHRREWQVPRGRHDAGHRKIFFELSLSRLPRRDVRSEFFTPAGESKIAARPDDRRPGRRGGDRLRHSQRGNPRVDRGRHTAAANHAHGCRRTFRVHHAGRRDVSPLRGGSKL